MSGGMDGARVSPVLSSAWARVLAAASVPILTLVLVLAPPLACADALERLDEFFKLETFRANFVQQVYSDEGVVEAISEGVVSFHRPGRFRWEYVTPDPYLILTDGLNLLIYDPSLQQAHVQPTKTALGSAPLMLLLDQRGVFEDFRVDYVGHGDDLEWARLEPRTDDTQFVRFDVGFDRDALVRIIFYDRFEQRTVVRFHGVETGVSIPRETFRADLPEDVDVIGDHLR